jgi:predicted dehydrogenase
MSEGAAGAAEPGGKGTAGESPVGVAVVGAGFIAETRARAYAAAGAGRVRVVAVVSRTRARAEDYGRRHRIEDVYTELSAVLGRPDVEVVDLCVPNHLHREMTELAAAHGKHVICSKPLTAVERVVPGEDGPAAMLAEAVESAEAMVRAASRARVLLMYAENWVYAPPIVKAARLAAASGGAILEMRGGECHSGSHSPYSRRWETSGGGALLRLGVHPLGAMLHLKREEGIRRYGRPIRVRAVTAETADLTRNPVFAGGDRQWMATGWVDVENWGSAILSFEDGTRGLVWASDATLGGMESSLQLFGSNAHIRCNLSHNRLVEAFTPDPSVFEGEYLMEKLETSAGWSHPAPDEDWVHGHLAMIDDFIACAATGRQPRATGELGRDVLEVVYAAYASAASGHRVTLPGRAGLTDSA